MYINRFLERTIKQYLKIFPAVAVTGPRQSGKSTMLQHLFQKEYKYVTFDDPINIEFFRKDPKGFMLNYSGKIIFDEVQKAPEIFDYLKIEIDRNRDVKGKYILTGSNRFEIHKNITESLAGRIGMMSLLPMQYTEIPVDLRSQFILNGSYPELIVNKYKYVREYYASYVENYIERDVRNIINIVNLRDFQRLIFLLAARVSQELNMNSLSKEIGVSVKTIQGWISILEASYIIFLLPSYHKNLGKRIIKRPKLYFYDPGIVCYLTGIRDMETLNQGPLGGSLFENMIVSEMKKAQLHLQKDLNLYYFRDNLGLECDLIIQDIKANKLTFMEIKKTHTYRSHMLDTVRKLIELEKNNSQKYQLEGILIYQGSEKIYFKDNIYCENFERFLKKF